MSDHRRIIEGAFVVGSLLVGALALSLANGLPAATPLQVAGAGASVHAKNAETPGWMLELQARNARQLPVTVRTEEPSFWI